MGLCSDEKIISLFIDDNGVFSVAVLDIDSTIYNRNIRLESEDDILEIILDVINRSLIDIACIEYILFSRNMHWFIKARIICSIIHGFLVSNHNIQIFNIDMYSAKNGIDIYMEWKQKGQDLVDKKITNIVDISPIYQLDCKYKEYQYENSN